jgi:hypothetical protein
MEEGWTSANRIWQTSIFAKRQQKGIKEKTKDREIEADAFLEVVVPALEEVRTNRSKPNLCAR